MDKNKFFEIATKVLSNEANETEKSRLASFLEIEQYRKLFNWLQKEWQKNCRYPDEGFDYQRGLKKLRNKIEQKEFLFQQGKQKLTFMNRKIIQVAAVFVSVILIASFLYIFTSSKSEITHFAETTKTETTSENTRLIIQGTTEIEIDTKESEINYCTTKGKVVVDDEKEIDQNVTRSIVTYNTVIVPYGKRSKIILTDGSTVWLNSGSKFIYPANFSPKKREVYLEGEAMFEVEHQENDPFIVITRDIEVEVLGTVFNVCAYNDDAFTSTVLESGSVKISYDNKNLLKQGKVRITPGTRARYDPANNEIIQQQVDTKYYTSWRDGILIYRNEYLPTIVKQLKRYYNKDIRIEDQRLTTRSFTGKLDLKEDVADVLSTIAFVSSLKINQSKNQFIIKQ